MQVYCLVLLLGLVSVLPTEARWNGRRRDKGPREGVKWHLATTEEECGQTEELTEGSPGDSCKDGTAGDELCLCLSRREEWKFVCGECSLRWKGNFKGVKRNKDKKVRWGGGGNKQFRRGKGKESRRRDPGGRRGRPRQGPRGGPRGGPRQGPGRREDIGDSTEINVEDATTMKPDEAMTENAAISQADKKRRKYAKYGDQKGRFQTRKKLRQKFKHNNKQRNGHHGNQEGKWRKKNHYQGGRLNKDGGRRNKDGGRRNKDQRQQEEDTQDQDQPKGTEHPVTSPSAAEQINIPNRQSVEASAATEPISPRVNRRRRRRSMDE